MTDSHSNTKQCAKCGDNKPEDQFHKYRSGNLRKNCKDCRKKKIKDISKRNRSYIWSLKKIRGCVDCGESNPFVLEFDHVRGEKENRVSNIVRSASLTRLKKEIDKCEVRCVNCHRLKTAKNQNWYKNMQDLSNLRMQTYTGKMFYPFEPERDQIDIEDIAHSLSRQCRFNGHTDQFYSVAQHSVYVADLVDDKDLKLTALMHDATETYIGDLPSPVKSGIGLYKELEESIWSVIADKYGLASTIPDAVKVADMKALATEKRDLVEDYGWCWGLDIEPAEFTIDSHARPEEAKSEFLRYFNRLMT